MPDLQCAVCAFSTKSLKAFVDHYKLHSNVANFNFPCGFQSCCRNFRKYASFRSHMYRDHRGNANVQLETLDVNLQCQISFCEFSCHNVRVFLGHLNSHIAENVEIQCPFKACVKTFSVRSSFTAHISRCHRARNISGLCESIVKTIEKEDQNSDDDEAAAVNDLEDYGDFNCYLSDTQVVTDSAQFVHSLALFYLKLQAKFLLPATIIQSIVEEMQNLHNFGLSCGLKNLSDRLLGLNICESDIDSLMRELQDDNPFRACSSGELRSHQTRQTYFKRNFKFVAPTQIYLGESKNNISRFAQYVPITETLKALFEDTSVKAAYDQTLPLDNSSDCNRVLCDIMDGQSFRRNQFFMQNPGALRLILYQDAFEVANPLGSGKKKHKILAVYFSLANLPPYYRSTVDHIQLILLCCETDFKHFGQRAVFGELVKDLQSLEDVGIELLDSNQPVFGSVLAIVGDNLGSHCIGGFTENFSTSSYVCRYCSIDRETANAMPHVIGSLRTPSHYDEIVSNMETDPTTETFGIKFRSVFNDLRYFHVCNPGLPPCLGHDLFEGTVTRDVALIIKHFVKVDKYFTYEHLNRLISRFKYVGSDAENKPCELKDNADKVGGHAVQNWYFLRLLPLLVGDRIRNKENPVWNLLLLLREIVDLVCAPAISLDQVALLKEYITDYLHRRVELFPDHRITPKHHYMAHYPGLIVQFGSLIRVWTLRFESKHSYFKNCVRKLRNFKNVCSTLADRHQLLQAYLSEGTFFPPQLIADSTLQFHVKLYAPDIKRAVSDMNFNPRHTIVASKATYRGTSYKPGIFVVMREIDNGLLLGRVVLILVHRGDSLFFILEKCRSIRCLDMGTLCVQETDDGCDMECVSCNQLLDYYPLVTYRKEFVTHIILHHAVQSSCRQNGGN